MDRWQRPARDALDVSDDTGGDAGESIYSYEEVDLALWNPGNEPTDGRDVVSVALGGSYEDLGDMLVATVGNGEQERG